VGVGSRVGDAIDREVPNPLGIEGLGAFTEAADALGFIATPVMLLVSVAAVFVRWRRAGGIEREQLKWLVYVAIIVVASLVGGLASASYFGEGSYLGFLAFSAGIAGLTVGVPVAIGVAVLRHHLYDIDLLINRTLVYAALTAAVVGVYVSVVGTVGAFLQARHELALSLFATGLVAVAFQPLRDRLQRGVNRLMYGDRDEPYQVLSRLGRRLEATLAPDQTLEVIVQTVRDALRLPYAAIGLRGESGSLAIAAMSGRSVPHPVSLPLSYHGEAVGELLLGPRPGETALTPADRRLLEDLARQAGVAVHAVRLTTDLQRSRERLISAREEERRRLRHDLHDELGPALASMSLQMAAARNLIPHEQAAIAILNTVKAQMQEAVADVRRVVAALRPPTLDELGLVGAVREHAARLSHDGLTVLVETPRPLPPLPAAVEVAAYRISREALTNVARHADARSAVVRLAVVDGSPSLDSASLSAGRWLDIRVTDDGRGIAPDALTGTGLISMRERAAELGGTFCVGPRLDGGTELVARLPLTHDEE
jgi:signal transduction histidine kinase